MSYCIRCGVELADSEPRCPLCGGPISETAEGGALRPVFAYPLDGQSALPRINRARFLPLLSVLFALPIIFSFFGDYDLHGHLDCAELATAALLLAYVVIVIPATLRTRPVFQLVLDLCCTEAALFFSALILQGDWFWLFAFPAALYPFASALLLILLRRKTGLPGLYIAALSCFSAGLYCLLLEWRINAVFHLRGSFFWSIFPFLVGIALAILLYFTERNHILKQKLARRFFF